MSRREIDGLSCVRKGGILLLLRAISLRVLLLDSTVKSVCGGKNDFYLIRKLRL